GFSVAEANIRYKEQIGLITQADAAIQLRNLHEQEYQERLAKLKEDLLLTKEGPTGQVDRDRIQQQITDLETRHTQQQLSDRLSASATYRAAINGANQNLASLMVGGHADFSGYFRGLGQQISEAGLKHIEAPFLSKLGLGKADGSVTNPFSVRIVDGI